MIEELLARNEDKTLDFKESTKSLSGIIKTVVAFANTAGGTIVIGVQDRTKKVIGVPNILDEEERLASAISDSIIPFIVPDIKLQTYRKKELIIIEVPHLAGPCYVKAAGPERGVFVRSGSTSRVADDATLNALKLYSQKISFDEVLSVPSTAKSLDWKVIEELFGDAGKKITERKAEDLGLLTTNMLTSGASRGGIILFGTSRLRTFPDAIVRCVRFAGSTKAKIVYHAEFDTYPLLALEQAIHFVNQNTLTGAQFGQLKRIDIPQYPLEAVREALINAILHTDYALIGQSIMVCIFDDRIEITNPGGVPLGMTLERALSGSSSIRNRVIARVVRELKLSEQFGSGLQRIIDACESHGLVQPKFEDFDTEFKVTLFAEKTDKKAAVDPEQEKFIGYLKKKEKVGTKEVAEFFGIAPRNARIKLKKFVDSGLIKKVGTSPHDPHGRYVLARKK